VDSKFTLFIRTKFWPIARKPLTYGFKFTIAKNKLCLKLTPLFVEFTSILGNCIDNIVTLIRVFRHNKHKVIRHE